MNTAVAAKEGQLSAAARPTSGAWAKKARDEAAVRLGDMGLPGRRDEYWKWTRPDGLISANAPHAAVFDYGSEGLVFDEIDRLKIVFVDGVFDADASDDLSMEASRSSGWKAPHRQIFIGQANFTVCWKREANHRFPVRWPPIIPRWRLMGF